MIRLPTARRCPSPIPLVLMLLALLALAGCGGAMKEAAAPSQSYGGEARAGNAAASLAPEEAAEPATESADFEDDNVEEAPLPERAPPPAAPGPAPVAQAAPPPPAPGSRAEAKKESDVTAPAPARPERHGVVTGSARAPEGGAFASPLLIYRANLTMAVFETKQALDRTEQIARDAGGYLVRRDDQSITVRVPAARFHGALAAMMKLGDVLHRDVSVEDVTAQYRDLQIRLKNAEAVRDRLAQLLKKAQSVKDALEVERELARVTDQIELMKGKLKLLHELVQFSTITIQFSARSTEHVDSTVKLPFPWLGDLGLAKLLNL